MIAEEDAFDPFASQRGMSPLAPPPAMAAAPLSASSPGLAPEPAPTPGFVAPPPAATIEAPPRRQRAIPVGAWIAIAGAMAFGVTLAVMVGIKLFGQAEAPLAVADPVPPPAPAPPEPAPEPVAETPEPVAEPQPEEAPPAETAPEPAAPQQGTRPQGTQGSGTRPAGETAPRPQTPRVDPEAAARLAQFQDDGAEAAPIAVGQRNNPLAEDRTRGTGELSADQIRTVVNRERAAVQRCYETAARMTGQAPSMRVDVDVTIGASGTVTSATARGQALGNISECIERSVRRWRFPASGGSTRTSIPFVFQGRDR
ncbi:MAG: AgmX/PglI C-terminal domain-containing protein [Sandaracinaceae bacterium]|nr:AgmX/PglI C-terminal domain-containing protein [Sandaracinaceae bacterium]